MKLLEKSNTKIVPLHTTDKSAAGSGTTTYYVNARLNAFVFTLAAKNIHLFLCSGFEQAFFPQVYHRFNKSVSIMARSGTVITGLELKRRNIMDLLFGNLFDFSTFLYLTGLLTAALFFAKSGIRDIKLGHYDGLVYIALSLFFVAAHVVFLFAGKADNTLFSFASRLDLTSWFVLLFAPALVILYLVFGLYDFIRMNLFEGFVRVFFGATLIGFLYIIGVDWAVSLKAFLTMLYCGAWIMLEISTFKEAQ